MSMFRNTGRSVGVSKLLGCLCLVTLVGCATVQRQGDRAFDKGNCLQALENYDEAAAAGTKDPKMYQRAAQCALKLGNLAGAERYYSQALRFGGGVPVARELAGFYVKTSNYVSAVRVYQYLLYQETDKQPVYNNLGTALMYAGQPFDAESYLMIAQQMDPGDPTPYVNLGLLYDRHLRQPWLAINFYECFNEITKGRATNAEMVRQRASELRDRYFRLYDADSVACGEPYRPAAAQVIPLEDLKRVVETELPDESPLPAPVVSDDAAGEGEAQVEGAPLVIERQVTDHAPTPERPGSVLGQARHAHSQERWAEAVGFFTAVPVADMTSEDQKRLGDAYRQQANWAMASHWLELAATTSDDPEIVAMLFDVYKRNKDEDRISALCKRYGNSRKYETITAGVCAESAPKKK